MTTQTRFTPGPWRNMEDFLCYVQTEAGLPVAVTHPHDIVHREAVADGVDCPEIDECIANGVLIASAPDLYAALEPFANAMLTPTGQVIGLMREDFERAIAALRRARGEA